jgi:hypothetical protein
MNKRKLWSVILLVLLGFIFVFTLFLTRYNAVSWNDRSRFATIENLVDRGTFQIDHTLFDTGDKVFVNGHFYSDKPLLFAVYAAWPYYILKNFSINIIDFDRLVIFATNALALVLPLILYFVLLFWFWRKYGGNFRTDRVLLLILLFWVGTALLPYSTQLNNHLPAAVLVGIATLFLYFKAKLGSLNVFMIGLLMSFAVTFDPGAIFILGFFSIYLIYLLYNQHQSEKKSLVANIILYLFACAIPIFLHGMVTIPVTGDMLPGSMHEEYFQYEGSPFVSGNLTGASMAVGSAREWVSYVGAMTFGRRGFFLHNPLALFGLLLAIWSIWQTREKRIKFFFLSSVLSVASVIAYYSLFGKGGSGSAFTVRWFIILIPLCFYPIIHWLRDSRGYRLIILAGLALVSTPWQIAAMGNVIGPANAFVDFHFLNMFAAFPEYFYLHYSSVVEYLLQ